MRKLYIKKFAGRYAYSQIMVRKSTHVIPPLFFSFEGFPLPRVQIKYEERPLYASCKCCLLILFG